FIACYSRIFLFSSHFIFFFFSSRRRHTRSKRDWSSDVCSSDLIALVEGDDVLPLRSSMGDITDLDSGQPAPPFMLTMNAYLGAGPIKAALDAGADIVLTGRIVDSALVLGPLMHHFGWSESDYDKLAQGSLAGHLIECGAQSTGGNFTDWHLVEGFDNMGFPVVECHANGDFILTKPAGTGGLV